VSDYSNKPNKYGDGGLSAAAVVLIVIGSVLFVALALVLVVKFVGRKSNNLSNVVSLINKKSDASNRNVEMLTNNGETNADAVKMNTKVKMINMPKHTTAIGGATNNSLCEGEGEMKAGEKSPPTPKRGDLSPREELVVTV
jgi:hypothetical protein